MKKGKKILLISVFVLALLGIFLIGEFYSTGKTTFDSKIKTIPLSDEERQKVSQILSSSEFIKDVPKDNPVAVIFYSFENGERIWRDGFLLGGGRLLSDGKPAVQISLDSRYISELNQNNLCDVVKEAKRNGDLGFYSEANKAILLIKYSGLLKYRSCFGF